MRTSVTVRIGRDTIDPQGVGSDEDVASCTEYVLDAVRAEWPDAEVTAVNNGGRTSGTTAEGEVIDAEVKRCVEAAYAAWNDSQGAEPAIDVDAVREVVAGAGEWAHGGDPQREAMRWTALGFDASAVSGWLDARCFDATAAKQLRDAGITPSQASRRTNGGLGGYSDTIAYKLSNGDLSAQTAVSLAGDA